MLYMCVCTYMYIMYITTIINPCDPYVSPSVNRHQVGLSELQAPLSSRLLLQYFSRLPALVVSPIIMWGSSSCETTRIAKKEKHMTSHTVT